MQITPFRIEEYMGKHEFSAKYLLSSSDGESVTIEEILSLEPGAHDAFLKHWCGYTESPGAPWLREVLAKIYKTIHADQVVVVAAAEEAIFLFYHALLTPQDHAIGRRHHANRYKFCGFLCRRRLTQKISTP